MSNYLKPLVVLLISILIFAGIAWLADKDILDFIQTRFYNPSIVKSYISENAKDAELAQNYINELQQLFSGTLAEPAVRNSFLYNQNADDIFERSKIYGLLIESTSGLQSVQFIDSNGIRIHYSTSFRDIIAQSSSSVSYRNYTEDSSALPYDIVSVPANSSPKFIMDEQGDRIIFSYPFNDSLDVYHGTALFSVSIRALAEKLISLGRLKVNENISVIYSPPGVLVGIPDAFKTEIQKKVSEIWTNGVRERITIDSEASGAKFSLISLKTGNGVFFGRLVNDDLFSISDSMKMILYISMFFTFYLALFFILNFKASPVTTVQNRIRKLREILFNEMHDDKSTQEKIRWLLELEQRRDEVKEELKYKLKLNSKTEKNIDAIIDKSWDEIIAIIRASSGHAALALKIASLDSKELIQKAQAEKSADIDEAEELEEITDVEALEEAEEIEEIEEAESIPLAEAFEAQEEITDIEALEEIDEAEELASIKDISSIEEIDDIENELKTGEFDEFAEEAEFVQDVDEISISIDESDGIQTAEKPAFIKEKPKTLTGGLLKLASKKAPAKGLLRLASEYAPVSHPSGYIGTRGLLARALAEVRLSNTGTDFDETKTASGKKGLLALASEIEFSSDYPVATHEIDDVVERNVDDQIEEIINIDIVSPFVSMFSSLDNVKIDD